MRSYLQNTAASKYTKHERLLYLLVFCATLMLYCLTLGPTFSWGDHADLPHRAVDWSDETFYFARTYWLYRSLAQPFLWLPIGDVAYRLNLMTAIFGAGTVLLVFHLVRTRTQSHLAAGLAAAALALSHTLWFLSVVAEVYSLGTFLLCAVLVAAQRVQANDVRNKDLLVFGLALGLFLSHHFAAILVFPAAGLLMLRFLSRPKLLGLFLLGLLLGGALFLFQFSQTWLSHGLEGIRDTFQTNQLGFYRSNWMRESVLFGAYLFYQFPIVGFIAGCSWLLLSPKLAQRRDLFLLAVMVTLVVWGVTNPIPDKFNAYVFFYPMFAVLIGMGLHEGLKMMEQQKIDGRKRLAIKRAVMVVTFAAPVLLYALTPTVTERLDVDLVKARTCPHRNNNRFFLQPWKQGDDGARRYASETLTAAEQNSTIVVDYTLWRPMLYLQKVEGVRQDVTLVWVEPLQKEDRVVAFLKEQIVHQTVYLAAVEPAHYYDYDKVKRYFKSKAESPLYRLTLREDEPIDQVRLD